MEKLHLGRFAGPASEVLHGTETTPRQAALLKALSVAEPPRFLGIEPTPVARTVLPASPSGPHLRAIAHGYTFTLQLRNPGHTRLPHSLKRAVDHPHYIATHPPAGYISRLTAPYTGEAKRGMRQEEETAVVDLNERVKEIGWYHQIELPGGVVTPGVNRSALALSRLDFPVSLAGESVLDVGAWDGFYSFEAAKRGAARVLATDSFVWQGRWKQDGFLLARQALGLQDIVEDRFIDVMDLSPEALGETFDVVLFLGVLYHLKDPLGALQRVSSVCKGLLVLETETALNFLPFPAARLWPGRELRDDDTNWWSMNRAALVALLRTFGFRDVRVAYQTPLVRRFGRALRSGRGFWAGFRGSRIVIQARR